MKCSGRQARPRANRPGSTRRASATTSAASAAQSRNPPSNMKFGRQAAGRARAHPEHAEDDGRGGADPMQGPTRLRAGWRRAAARKARVAPAMRSNRRVSVP